VITFFGAAALVALALSLPFIGRVIAGPTVFDRVQARNGVGSLSAIVMLSVGLASARVDMFVDMVLALFVLNLFTTLLIARYVRDRAEREGPVTGEEARQ
jgi:multicomponent Na+:H+ antiporter subunit F